MQNQLVLKMITSEERLSEERMGEDETAQELIWVIYELSCILWRKYETMVTY